MKSITMLLYRTEHSGTYWEDRYWIVLDGTPIACFEDPQDYLRTLSAVLRALSPQLWGR